MRTFFLTALAMTLYLAGCQYQAPLTTQHNIAIDPEVLGKWEFVPKESSEDSSDETEKEEKREVLMVLKFSDTEYLIHYPVNRAGMYFRGYPVRIGNVSCVQLQLIGTEKDSITTDDEKRYHVVSYQLSEGLLKIDVLNDKIVSGDLKKSKELKQAVLENQNAQDLFHEPGTFRKISDE
jgi:hypothetical protein